MITNKERLEKLIEQIKRLATLSEEILEREIYPVSFFSQAYDIVNNIQDDLHQMEIVQVELFEEKQVKAEKKTYTSPLMNEKQTNTPLLAEEKQSGTYLVTEEKKTITSSLAEEKKTITSLLTEEKKRVDLQKLMTLNDRFLYCRELFAGNNALMDQTISELNQETSHESSVEYIKNHFDWNFKNEHVADFMRVIKKRFA